MSFELDKAELTRHLLENAQTVGEVKGLVSQILEHYKSFNNDRKQENDKLWNALTKISDNQLIGQKDIREEIKQLVIGMNKKIESSEELCETKHKTLETEVNSLKESRASFGGAFKATAVISSVLGGVFGFLANKLWP